MRSAEYSKPVTSDREPESRESGCSVEIAVDPTAGESAGRHASTDRAGGSSQRRQAAHVTLSGWVRPDASYFSGCGSLCLLVIGDFAGEEAQLRVDLIDAHRHGYPCDADDRITTIYGNWLELSGAFRPSPIDDTDSDREQLGYLEVESITFRKRAESAPRPLGYGHLPLKRLTVRFPKTMPRS